MASSLEAVLSTVELVEQVLLHLELHQIFAVKRVSPTFRNVVANSTLLRRKIFELPGEERNHERSENSNGDGRADRDDNVRQDDCWPTASHWIECFDDRRLAGQAQWRLCSPFTQLMLRVKAHEQDSQKPPLSGLRDVESWRNVLFCTPPVTEVCVDIYFEAVKSAAASTTDFPYRLSVLYQGIITNPRGITVDDVSSFRYRRIKTAADLYKAFDPLQCSAIHYLDPFSAIVFKHRLPGQLEYWVDDSLSFSVRDVDVFVFSDIMPLR